MKKVLLIALFFMQTAVFATLTAEQYIEEYKDDAIKEMLEYGVPASITLAQGMLESNYGNSKLAQNAKNHFGIKCHSDWTGDTYHMDDDTKNECFRKYNDVLESYRDHSKFLKERSRYAGLFQLKMTDYKAWAQGLKAAGYATNPKYPQLLTDIVERYNLHQFDSWTEKELTAEKDTTLHPILQSKNFVKYVVARKKDDFESLSKELQISIRRLKKYNDVNDSVSLKEGDFIYTQPKRRRGTEAIYVVQSNDTYLGISQKFAIQLKHLYKKNNILPGSSPVAGEKLYLRKKKR